MAENTPEAPAFVASFWDVRGDPNILLPGGTPVWPDIPNVRVQGEWQTHELRIATHPLGRVALVGDCFVDNQKLQDTLGQAITSEKPELLTHFPGSYAVMLL